MGVIVQKFGGSSVRDKEHLFRVAQIIADTHRAGNDVVAVVSAQGDTTDDLLQKAAEVTHNPSLREMDVLLSTGEQTTIALLAMALHTIGCKAKSLTGWQAGFYTDCAHTKAQIRRLNCARIYQELHANQVVVVAGFQGVDQCQDITTLGRGGSDTSAVAIAAMLQADRCQIFTDVDGIYTADPRKVPTARKLRESTYDEMLELAAQGSQVLNPRSVELAQKYQVELEVCSSLHPSLGTVVKRAAPDMEGALLRGITKDTHVAMITISGLTNVSDVCGQILAALAQKEVQVDLIAQTSGTLQISIPDADAEKARSVLQGCCVHCGGQVSCDLDCAKISVVGTGLRSNCNVSAKLFSVLEKNKIFPRMVATSEIRISTIVAKQEADLAVRVIHDKLVDPKPELGNL